MGGDDFFWPMIVRSVGTVFMFLPLQLAAIGPLPREEIGGATAFFNLTRQLGGSFGVAGLTLLLDHRTTFHHAVLAEKLMSDAPMVLSRVEAMTASFVAHGFDPASAHQRALALLDAGVQKQAAVLSFVDSFHATAFLLVLVIPLVFLLGKPKPANAAAAAAAGH
jgi:DHA2 family multidrug resistance protein